MVIESVIESEYVHSVDARLNSQDAYIEYQVHEGRRAVPFLSGFFNLKDAPVLEIGTGRGGKSIAYACAGMKVTALDVDEESLIWGKQAAQARGTPVQFLSGDGARLPFPSNAFVAVLLDSVIEHVRDPLAVLQECDRVLKPGGIVFIVFPPFYGPLSGHIDDYVMIPWYHLLPRSIVRRYLMARAHPIGILTPEGAYAVYASLNGLTIHQFKSLAHRAGLAVEYFRVRPFLTHPGTRFAVGLASAVVHGPRISKLRAVLTQARREFDPGTALLFVLLSAIAPLVWIPFLQEIAAGGCKCVLRKRGCL